MKTLADLYWHFAEKKKVRHSTTASPELLKLVTQCIQKNVAVVGDIKIYSFSDFDWGTSMWDMGGATYTVRVFKGERKIFESISSNAPIASAMYGVGTRTEVNAIEEENLTNQLQQLLG